MPFSRAVITTIAGSTGVQTFTHTDIEKCCACIVVINKSTSYGTYTTGVKSSWGFATNGNIAFSNEQQCRGYASASGAATSNTAFYNSVTKVAVVPDWSNGATEIEGVIDSWVDDGVKINWTKRNASLNIVVILFSFVGLSDCRLDDYNVNTNPVTRSLGFKPDVSFFMGNTSSRTDSGNVHGGISIGLLGHTTVGAIQQGCAACMGVDNAGSSNTALGHYNSSNSIYAYPFWDALKHRWYVSSETSNGYTVSQTVTNGANVRLSVLSFKMKNNQSTGMRSGVSNVANDRDATRTNSWGWVPDSVFMTGVESNSASWNTHQITGNAAPFFWYANDAGQITALGFRERDGAATTDVGSIARSARFTTTSYVSSSLNYEVLDDGGIDLTGTTSWSYKLKTTSGAAYANIPTIQLGVVDDQFVSNIYQASTKIGQDELTIGSTSVDAVYVGTTKIFG